MTRTIDSLEGLLQKIVAEDRRKHDVIADTRKMSAEVTESGKVEIHLDGDNGLTTFDMTDHAVGQIAMRLDYLVRTKTPYYWPEDVNVPDEDDLAWFAATLQTVADGVEQGDYQPTGLGTRACSSCPYKSICGPYQRYQKITSPLRQEVNDA